MQLRQQRVTAAPALQALKTATAGEAVQRNQHANHSQLHGWRQPLNGVYRQEQQCYNSSTYAAQTNPPALHCWHMQMLLDSTTVHDLKQHIERKEGAGPATFPSHAPAEQLHMLRQQAAQIAMQYCWCCVTPCLSFLQASFICMLLFLTCLVAFRRASAPAAAAVCWPGAVPRLSSAAGPLRP